MSRQFPIWVQITSCIYKGDKSYGIRSKSTQNIKVGTSADNSHHFATIQIVHIPDYDNHTNKTFQIFLDDVLIKEGRFEKDILTITKKGKQG